MDSSIKGVAQRKPAGCKTPKPADVIHDLHPALKSWLDNVIIPALVDAYVNEIQTNKWLDSNPSFLAESVSVKPPLDGDTK